MDYHRPKESRSYEVDRALEYIHKNSPENLNQAYSEIDAYEILDNLFPEKFIEISLDKKVSKEKIQETINNKKIRIKSLNKMNPYLC